MRSVYDALNEEAFEYGRQLGRMEAGVQLGVEIERRASAKWLLERRFGTLPPPVTERLAQASLEDVTRWRRAALAADSLDAVFDDE